METGAIVAIGVISAVVLIALLIGATYLVRKRWKSEELKKLQGKLSDYQGFEVVQVSSPYTHASFVAAPAPGQSSDFVIPKKRNKKNSSKYIAYIAQASQLSQIKSHETISRAPFFRLNSQ